MNDERLEAKHLQNMANIITIFRILCAAMLLLCPALSPSFYALYVIAGLTDMLDGAVARKTKTASAFGSRLDTTADFLLVVVCIIKLLPVFDIPTWLFIWIIVIALIKLCNIISGYVTRNRFVALHTFMNKATGILLFFVPLTFSLVDLKYSAPIVCAAATVAAVQEGHYIRTGREK